MKGYCKVEIIMKKFSLLMFSVLASAMIATNADNDVFAAEGGNQTAADGIYLGDISVGGMNDEAITKEVEAYINGYTSKKITLSMDDNKYDLTAGQLGYTWGNKKVVEEIMNYGNYGNVIERYKAREDIKKTNVTYPIDVKINKKTLKKAIEENMSQFNIPHTNAGIVKNGDSFDITESKIGRVIDLNTSAEALSKFLLEEWDGNDSQFTLTVVDDEPTVSADACREVKDVIGTFSTSFTIAGNYNRNMNMKNGIEHINGNVIYPGETFSVNSVLEPWTESNGWYNAGTYVNGRVENSLGGGICQVSTTLYNAVLRAELEVAERAPHSMNVGYVDLAADAALAGTWKDLKVTNDTDVPVYIEGIYDPAGKLTFNLYGKETRNPNRTLKFVSETISTNYPNEVVTEDPSKPAGYRAVTTQGHIGYVAKLWKEIYEGGKMVDRQLVNTSTYQASPIYVIYGTGGEETKDPDKQEETTKKKKKDEESTTKKKKEETTKKEKQTEKTTEAQSEAQTQEQVEEQESD